VGAIPLSSEDGEIYDPPKGLSDLVWELRDYSISLATSERETKYLPRLIAGAETVRIWSIVVFLRKLSNQSLCRL
jgi:hypothetical protein